ncbi:2-hydroxyacid dehydrogenase [Streptomyces daghestanicus]|jgi:phosphoglycerate dehydrogenase-like enzyme|uniref:2-hydroxyacid dehydrogenase n=4 Tax=Streptomyces TaxID=1883 RepID=A0A918GJ75_STRGD|nr:phosphoglycerate dehydrogenase-like enzyme [Streptomyces griseoviridis]GGS40621.1 2-hydroxyacid dehydrogenase [Streptomyces niveoruber]GGT00614.1 2-hydroxyacid dehydrogenase [Streptomyces griseoviridis]GGU24759.1 2-hydroxyacid dehydrogenase [Streptomyces daghestanicus]GHI29777.1 2-hydroxyacid dehydrogenase [Streptomyces daghestanicus]
MTATDDTAPDTSRAPRTTAPALVSTRRPRTVLAMSRETGDALRHEGAVDRLLEVADLAPDLLVTDFADPAAAPALADAEVLLTHWGCPPLTGRALTAMPRLRAVVHAAGSVKHHITDAVWERGIAVSSASAANALPVAEYTLAVILLAGKRVLDSARLYRERRVRYPLLPYYAGHGNYRRVVGVVGASRTGRRVIELLRPFDFTVLVHDPYLDDAEAARLGVRRAGLDELARRSHVVTIHAPELPETRHLFDARRLALLPDGATLVNTARGSLVDTEALVTQLTSGRIHAVLDVTEPDVPPADSPLYGLPNVLLTPHIAGSLGGELGRLADHAAAEISRYARGRPFAHPVTAQELSRTA